ncbi:hypothetical protein DQ384_39510 [Sphaerisporangium album]|uniref:Uncharacterized protein n=1 Tax=Sphaerisporangium album TaxID=509200 RepID=A0A367EI72_9ACTN|nr:hypothetical protein [Sphaerisporangium album]RCG17786.1 hypothetical protein DQ384_39510 [Sphaerisporangium album]
MCSDLSSPQPPIAPGCGETAAAIEEAAEHPETGAQVQEQQVAAPAWHREFLTVLVDAAAVSYVCRDIGIDYATVLRHRRIYPEFDEAYRRVMNERRARRAAKTGKPWEPPRVAPAWHGRFLTVLAQAATVEAACREAKVSPNTVLRHRGAYPDFDKAYQQVMCERDTRWHAEFLQRVKSGSSFHAAAAAMRVPRSRPRPPAKPVVLRGTSWHPDLPPLIEAGLTRVQAAERLDIGVATLTRHLSRHQELRQAVQQAEESAWRGGRRRSRGRGSRGGSRDQ